MADQPPGFDRFQYAHDVTGSRHAHNDLQRLEKQEKVRGKSYLQNITQFEAELLKNGSAASVATQKWLIFSLHQLNFVTVDISHTIFACCKQSKTGKTWDQDQGQMEAGLIYKGGQASLPNTPPPTPLLPPHKKILHRKLYNQKFILSSSLLSCMLNPINHIQKQKKKLIIRRPQSATPPNFHMAQTQWRSQDIADARAQHGPTMFVRTTAQSAGAFRVVQGMLSPENVQNFTASQVGSEAVLQCNVRHLYGKLVYSECSHG